MTWINSCRSAAALIMGSAVLAIALPAAAQAPVTGGQATPQTRNPAIEGQTTAPGGGTASAPGPREYLLTVTRPHHLQVIDMASNTVLRTCELPGRMGPGSLAPAPNGRTVYVLIDGWENVFGINVETCGVEFSAIQSEGDIRTKSFGSMAVSPDGQELYTVQNRVRWHPDHAEVLEPQLAVYRTADGENAQPVRTFPVDRRITTMAATRTGKVVMGGADIKEIDPRTGEIRTLAALQNWDRPSWGTPDAFSMFSLGEQANEYLLPYTVGQFKDGGKDPKTAEWWWGMTRVDLATGKFEQTEFTPLEVVIFNFVSDPKDRNTVYGVFNTLSKYDVKNKKMIKRVGIDHSHYNINISSDGKRLYLGGTANDIAVHDAGTLEKTGTIELSGAMGASDLRVLKRRE